MIRSVPLLAVLAVLAALPAAASAQGESSDNPSLNQYTESVPTPRGERRTQGGPRERPVPLPAAARRELEREGGADAEALGAIATSPKLGAPQAPSRPAAGGGGGRDESAAGGSQSAVGAAAGATASSAVAPLAAILAAMLLVTAGVALLRRRARAG